MSGIDVLETLLNDAIEAHFHRVAVYPANKARVNLMHKESEEARNAVAELIEAAEEVKADAAILGMDIPRLDAALRRVKGESE